MPANAVPWRATARDFYHGLLEQAREDLLFVDPYLDLDFVARYLPQIKSGVAVRLLTSKEKLSSLLPAVETFVAESKLQVQVRSVSPGLHDRFVFVDKKRCFQSGASFKDGARKAPATIIQITDTFEEILQGYEDIWNRAETKFGKCAGLKSQVTTNDDNDEVL